MNTLSTRRRAARSKSAVAGVLTILAFTVLLPACGCQAVQRYAQHRAEQKQLWSPPAAALGAPAQSPYEPGSFGRFADRSESNNGAGGPDAGDMVAAAAHRDGAFNGSSNGSRDSGGELRNGVGRAHRIGDPAAVGGDDSQAGVVRVASNPAEPLTVGRSPDSQRGAPNDLASGAASHVEEFSPGAVTPAAGAVSRGNRSRGARFLGGSTAHPGGSTAGTPSADGRESAAAERSGVSAGGVTQTGFTADLQAAAARPANVAVPGSISFSPAEPRLPDAAAAIPTAWGQPVRDDTGGASALARLYPDEYLFDGGDRDTPVHYDTLSRHGLDTEDTIAEFADDTGEQHVMATNRVAIYAPRFASVQTISGLGGGTQVAKLAFADDHTRSSAVRSRIVPDAKGQNEAVVAARVRSRASGLESGDSGRTLHQALAVVNHVKLLNAFQDIRFLRSGRIEQSDEARLAYGLQAAMNWSRDESPVISGMTQSLHEVTAKFRPMEIVGRDVEHLKKGKLRIVKLADKKVARPGDVITFTIRFDNLGERPLTHIRIVDNLTPRLEFIEDSAQANLPGSLKVEDNEEGSAVLTFEMDNPLPGHSGGVITFQARLR